MEEGRKKKPTGFCCGLFAFFLYILLFLLFAIGTAVLVVSGLAYTEIGHFAFLYFGIGLGATMIIVALVTTISVCSRSKCGIIIVFLILGSLVGIELYIATYKGVNINTTNANQEFAQFWQKMTDGEKTNFQKALSCCGIDGQDNDSSTCPEGATQTCTKAVDDYITKLDNNALYIMYGAVAVEAGIFALSFLIVFCSC